MKKTKHALALLLALLMLSALPACATPGSQPAQAPAPASPTQAPAPSAVPSPSAAPSAAPTPVPEPGMLVGVWVAQIDMTDLLLEKIENGTGVELSLADFMAEPFRFPVSVRFDADGSYRFYVDGEALQQALEPVRRALKDFISEAMLLLIRQSLANAGRDVAGIRTKADIEQLRGESFDEILASALGMDPEAYIESILSGVDLMTVTQSLEKSGSYRFDGSTLEMDDDMLRVTFLDENSFFLDGDDSSIDPALLPMVFTRSH